MRKFLAYSLLFCISVLSLPRELIHSHDGETHQHEPVSDGNSFENPDCFLCDFALENYTVPTPTINGVTYQIGADVSFEPKSILLSTEFTVFSHRGPPTV